MNMDDTLQIALSNFLSEDEEKHKFAIETLISKGSEAVEGLITLLTSSDERIVDRSIKVIALIGADIQTTSRMIEILHLRYADDRAAIAQAINKPDDHSLITLMRFLQHPFSAIRNDAINALNTIGDVVAVPSLILALEDETGWVRLSAVRALMKIKDKRAIPGLIKALRDQDETVRYDAAFALGTFQATQAVPELIKRLSDKAVYGLAYTGQRVCDAAAIALGQIRDVQAVPHLIKLVQKQTLLSRYNAIYALGEIGNPSAVSCLIESLEDERQHFMFGQRRISDFAAEALEKIGTPEAIEAVKKRL